MRKFIAKSLPFACAQILLAVALAPHSLVQAETPVCDYSIANATAQCMCPCNCPVPIAGPTKPPGGLFSCYGGDCPQLPPHQLDAIAKAVQELGLFGLIGNDNIVLTRKPGNDVIQKLRSMILQPGTTIDPETQYFFPIDGSVHNYIGATGSMLSK